MWRSQAQMEQQGKSLATVEEKLVEKLAPPLGEFIWCYLLVLGDISHLTAGFF